MLLNCLLLYIRQYLSWCLQVKIKTYSKVVQYRHVKYQCHNYVAFVETIELSFLGQLQEGV